MRLRELVANLEGPQETQRDPRRLACCVAILQDLLDEPEGLGSLQACPGAQFYVQPQLTQRPQWAAPACWPHYPTYLPHATLSASPSVRKHPRLER